MKQNLLRISTLLLAGLIMVGCNLNGTSTSDPTTADDTDTTAPYVVSTYPLDNAADVPINRSVTVTFSEAMLPESISATTFTLKKGTTIVTGTVTYEGTTAMFTPNTTLDTNAIYTGTITTSVKDLAGNSLATENSWAFLTGTTVAAGPAPVNLGTAASFAILSKTGVDTTTGSTVTGDIGVSPAAATYLTGFSLSADASNQFSTSSQVIGKAYAANYAPPTPAKMTTAVSDMELAYTSAAGRTIPNHTELGAGDISGLTLAPGLYKWGTGLLIATDVTLSGGSNDVWIFQVSGDITMASGVKVILTGGAVAKNVFWQSYGAVALNTTSHIEGTVLSQTEITLATGATVNGRLLSQTAVTLDQCTVTKPAN